MLGGTRLGVAQQGARDGNALALPARKLAALLADGRVVAARETGKQRGEQAQLANSALTQVLCRGRRQADEQGSTAQHHNPANKPPSSSHPFGSLEMKACALAAVAAATTSSYVAPGVLFMMFS